MTVGYSQCITISNATETMTMTTPTTRPDDATMSRLTADDSGIVMCVRDPEGGVWWPNDEATAEIDAAKTADDAIATAVHICHHEPTRGEWWS